MNTTQTTIFNAVKVQRYNFFELIDKKSSFLSIQQKLSSFCKEWRKKHRRGGITANHRELIWALLKILPASMEWQRENQPRRFGHALKFGRFKIVTNRPTIAKKMLDCKQFATQFDLPSDRTITNLLNRLVDAGVLLYKRTEAAKYNPKAKSLLIEFNPDLIQLYSISEEIEAEEIEAGEGNSDCNPTIATGGEVASDSQQQSLEFVEGWILAAQKIAEQERLTKSHNQQQQGNRGSKNLQLGKSLQHYTTNLNSTLKEKEKRKDKALTNVNNFLSVTEKQSRQNKNNSPIYLLYSQFLNQLYKKNSLPIEQEQSCLEMLNQFFEAAKGFVQDWRGYCIRKVQQSSKYQQAKNKERFLLNFQKRLPNIERKAFEVVSNAINIQAEYIARKGYDFYMNPVNYLAKKFFKPLEYSKEQTKLSWQHPLNNTFLVVQSRINTELWRAVSNVSLVYQKEGSQRALATYAAEYKKLNNLINSPDCMELTANKRQIYLQRLQQQLHHLFN